MDDGKMRGARETFTVVDEIKEGPAWKWKEKMIRRGFLTSQEVRDSVEFRTGMRGLTYPMPGTLRSAGLEERELTKELEEELTEEAERGYDITKLIPRNALEELAGPVRDEVTSWAERKARRQSPWAWRVWTRKVVTLKVPFLMGGLGRSEELPAGQPEVSGRRIGDDEIRITKAWERELGEGLFAMADLAETEQEEMRRAEKEREREGRKAEEESAGRRSQEEDTRGGDVNERLGKERTT